MKKIAFFILLSIYLIGCGTDYFYSSFLIRKDFQWLKSASEQKTLNDYSSISSASADFNNYTSPSIIATPANYMMVIFESRENFNEDMIGIDGNKLVDVNVKISTDALTFKPSAVIGQRAGSGLNGHGSPVSFLARDGNVVVLSTTGIGFGDGTAVDIAKIAVSISSDNGANWSDWKIIETNAFEPLLKDNYTRFYTTPGNGIVLGNGTLACTIDYKTKGPATEAPVGSAILYSTDNGKTWQIGATMKYNTSHRFAKIIAERNDGKLLMAAVPNTGNNYKTTEKLAWYLADSITGTITKIDVTSPIVDDKNGSKIILFDYNSGGVVSGSKIKLVSNGISKNAIILFHSYPERLYYNGYNTYSVYNCSAVSISEDDGKTWNMITNIVGTQNIDKTSFRHSVNILKDGTIALSYEEGRGQEINSTQNFSIAYRRLSLYFLSNGKYSYEGF